MTELLALTDANSEHELRRFSLRNWLTLHLAKREAVIEDQACSRHQLTPNTIG
jgi:hypothetical protein